MNSDLKDENVYEPLGMSCESDDSISTVSQSEDNDVLPCIIYTSDDSAEVTHSETTFADSDSLGCFIQLSSQNQENESADQPLLNSNCPSPQILVDPEENFSHQLPSAVFCSGSENFKHTDCCMRVDRRSSLYHANLLSVKKDVDTFTRSISVSTESSDCGPEGQELLLPAYQPLKDFPDDDFDTIEFGLGAYDAVKRKMIPISRHLMVGDILIDPKYKDSVYVHWPWKRIRYVCALFNLSVLISLLCICVALLVQMPRGTECDPKQEWWQGSVTYHIFIPSFQDSDNDGIGDLTGVINKLDYIQNLGIKTVRLSSVFPEKNDFLESERMVRSYIMVNPAFGSLDNLQQLCSLLHERGMHILLDLPLYQKNYENNNSTLPAVDVTVCSIKDISLVLDFWLEFGIDGFAFPDIYKCIYYQQLLFYMQKWRNALDSYSYYPYSKVMMVPKQFLELVASLSSLSLEHILRITNLIDVYISPATSGSAFTMLLHTATAWESHSPVYPWINWNMGGLGQPRITSVTNESSVGRLLFLLFLPGTATLYYGDELELPSTNWSYSWASIMQWSTESYAGFSEHIPWNTLSEDWKVSNVEVKNNSINAVTEMIVARQQKVPLYVNGIYKNTDTSQPVKSVNYKVRLQEDDILIMERHYPRRRTCSVVINLSNIILIKDLSYIYYGAEILASSHGRKGYTKFRDMKLLPGEAIVFILDE